MMIGLEDNSELDYSNTIIDYEYES